MLLDAGAPVDQAAASGATAAYLATMGSNVNVLQLLLERRANPNQADPMKMTLLHQAVQVWSGGGRTIDGTGRTPERLECYGGWCCPVPGTVQGRCPSHERAGGGGGLSWAPKSSVDEASCHVGRLV